MNFRNRVVIVTGGSRGLGLLMARRFSKEGARLALLARNGTELQRAAAELDPGGRQVISIVCDVADRNQVNRAVDIVLQRFGRIDVLVNNAGVIQVGPLEHMTDADFQHAMDVHFWGALHCMQAVTPHLRRRGGGRIVNIASIGGQIGVPHLAPYVASKFALVGLSDVVRAELRKYGIRVTTVCPGLMRTGSVMNVLVKGRHQAEFAWFAALSSIPGLSIDGDRAAAKIVRACREGRSHLTITPHAWMAAVLDRVAPSLMATLVALSTRLLPGAGGAEGDESKLGRDLWPDHLPRLISKPVEQTALRNNELAPLPASFPPSPSL